MLRHIPSNELFTILIVIGLIFISLAKLLYPVRFVEFLSVFSKYKYFNIYAREQKFFDKFDAFLFVNLIISASIFCSIFYHLDASVSVHSINILFKFIVGIGILILIKVLLERLVGSLFDIDTMVDQYLFQKISYKNFLGLLLVPINALLIYGLIPTLTTLYIIITILLIINLIGLISSFKTYQSPVKTNIFYFILYLCALEIAPYVILYKVFKP
jgi:hypothetical protein